MAGWKSKVELPEGWIETVNNTNGRKIKIYTNEETGKRLYSKTEVMRYVNKSVTQESPQQLTQNITPQQPVHFSYPQQPSQQQSLAIEDIPNNETVSTNEILDWLPSGWRVEVKSSKTGAHKGRDYKSYVDPSTGRKFYSKPEVLRHLKSIEHGDMTVNSKKRKHVPKNSSSVKPNEQVDDSPSKQKPDDSISKRMKTADATPAELTERTDASLDKENPTPGWLPSGWKIVFKTKKRGKYKCFIDPTTGFKFYSKPEVLMFLNGGKRVASSRKKNNLSYLKPTKKRGVKQVMDKFAKEQKGSISQVIRDTPNKLPPGWFKEIRIQKQGNNIRKDPYYTDPVSGYVFRSQTDALRYLETGDINVCAIRPKKRDELDWLSGDIKRDVKQVANKFTDEHEGPLSQVIIDRDTPHKLPPGWIKEIRIQKQGDNIRKDPYYTDPVSGYVFRSQTDALRYLETGDIKTCAIRPRKRDELDWLSGDIKNTFQCQVNQVAGDKPTDELKSAPCQESTNSKKMIVVERHNTPDKLPSGWVKEIKIQMKGNNIRKDPYYTDPVSGYVFRSQTDALRYLETGDINVCAMRPKKRDELDWLSGDIKYSSQVQGESFKGKQTSISGSLETKSNYLSTKRRGRPRSSKNNDETPESNSKKESPKKDPHPKSVASGRNEAKAVNDENGEQRPPVVDGKRPRGRKKAYAGTMKMKTNLPSRTSKRLSGFKAGTIEKGKGEPVQTEPENNAVKPSLAEALKQNVREEAAVENNPTPNLNPPIKETINKRVEENNHHHQQEVDLYHQLGGSSSSSPWTEIIKEPETTTWLMNPLSLDFSFKTHGSNTNEQGPIVQDYFQQEANAANKKADMGAPGFTSFNLFQGNVTAPAPPSAGPYNFLQTSSQSSPANPLFYSGIMPTHQSSPQNLQFPPDNTQNHQSPAHPMFPPHGEHGGFGFGFQ